MDRPKGPLAHLLRPNTSQSPNTTFGNISRDTSLSHKGGARSERAGSNEPQRLSARSRNKLFGGYTSHDFVTARARCAITTAMQPSTSINMGLIAVPKVESNSSSRPSLPLQEGILTHSTTTQTTAFKAPAVTFLSRTINGAVCGNYKLSPFLYS